MALDFSYYNALTSGYQNSQQRRAIRQQEENRQLQQLQMLQQQQQQNVQNQQQMQQQIMQAEQLVQKITGSKFGRQKDIDDMKKWSSEYSGWNDIKQIIKDYLKQDSQLGSHDKGELQKQKMVTQKFLKDSSNIINYLVKEFEMKKNAKLHA